MYVFVHPRVLSAYTSEYLSHKEDVGYIAQSACYGVKLITVCILCAGLYCMTVTLHCSVG